MNYYFKGDYHEETYAHYLELLDKVPGTDRYYDTLTYVLAAIGRKDLEECLSSEGIDIEILDTKCERLTNSEKMLVELAFQLFSNNNFFDQADGQPEVTTVHSIFQSLDEENTKVALSAISKRYL